ncbi:MAG: hypothetical protein JWM57_3051 [Phycisphaerales bacterium]|nr:hypothetical protein [Phycisphaerales bacterium]
MKNPHPTAWWPTFVACAIALASNVGSAATPAAPTTRPGLHLMTPAGWKQDQEPSPDGKKAGGIIITAPAAVHLRLRIQPIPLGDKVLADDVIQKLVTNMAKPELGDQAVPPLEKLEGPASGFMVTFTPAKQADKGEKFVVTAAVVQMPGLALAASITHRENSEWLDDALTIVKTATFGRSAKPAK